MLYLLANVYYPIELKKPTTKNTSRCEPQILYVQGHLATKNILISNCEQARESARRGLMEDASPRDRAAVVVESLAAMDSAEIAETVINISGYQVLFI